MKKIILMVLISIIFFGCATLSFKDVAEPFFEKYGAPSKIEHYQSGGYYFITWTWWDRKLMIRFEDLPYGWGWKVNTIYEW